MGVVAALSVVGSLLVVVAPSARAATPPLTLAKTGPATVLEGSAARYTLTASNPPASAGGVAQFNVSFSDSLPVGVAYTPGSTLPADLGDPTVIADPTTGAQTLIWSDNFDLQAGSTDNISFEVTPDSAIWPVDSTFTDTATAFGSTNARVIPAFGASGAPIPNAAVLPSAPSSASTTITSLAVSKAEPSPEGKLLRGIHDHPTVYTLTVTNGALSSTEDVLVNDFLPASLEFLGCGGVDNSTTGPEYPGAPSLTATPSVGVNCLTPTAVDTVTAPPGLPAGVYTQVTWDVGTLAPNQVLTIRYAAGIPLQQNTLSFPAGTPTPASLGQTANLDNNNGPTTRQNGAAQGLTNDVQVTGTYTGTVSPGGSPDIEADSSHTVTSHDLRMVKSVNPADFSGGGLATYTLQLASSEYVDNSNIVVTDTIPNGVCPLDTTTNYASGAPPDCAPGAVAPSVPYQSVTQNPDGTFTVVFDPIAIPRNGTATITYQARMRTTFTGGSLAGVPTATGDSFTNSAELDATSTPRLGTGEAGAATVTDSSSVTQSSIGGGLTKLIQPRQANQDCANDTYAGPGSLTPDQATFLKGDRICFELTATFATLNETRNPVLSDLLPIGTDFESASFVLGPANTLPAADVNFDSSQAADGLLLWKLGALGSDGANKVPPGAVFQARFSVLVTAPSPTAAPSQALNLAKLRAENTAGQARSLRASAAFLIDPAPPVSITKGVSSVNGLPAAGNPPNTDHVQVREGDRVVFRVDVTNGATSSTSVHTVRVWDVLAPGIDCADVSDISDGGVCSNPGDPGQPSFANAATRSAIVWNAAATDVIAPGASTTHTYAVTIPTGQGVDEDLVDTASVRSFNADNNVPGIDTVYFPQNNVDTSVPVADQDAPPASDNSDVFLPAVTVAKTVASAIKEAGNAGQETPPGLASTQATIGEQVTYTVYADIPAHTTVYGGALTDPLPTGLTLISASPGFSADAGVTPPTGALPPGSNFDAARLILTLPPVLDNTSATALRFAVTILAQVNTDGTNVAGVTRTNTATFRSQAPPGGTAPVDRSGSAAVVIVEPQPSLAKSATPANVVGGQTVTYTLTASNAAAASVLHAGWVADCLPAGLTFAAYGTPGQGSTVAPTPGDGTVCASGTTQLEWNVGDIAPGAAPKLTYTATVTPAATGRQTFTNNANITGNSLAGVRSGPADPGSADGREYTARTSRTITVIGANVIKSVTPSTATIGQTVTYTVTAVVAPNVSFFNATVVDTLPATIDPTSLQLQSVTCLRSDGADCDLSAATPLTPSTSGGSTTVGFLVGDAIGEPLLREVTIVYTARVAERRGGTGRGHDQQLGPRRLGQRRPHATDVGRRPVRPHVGHRRRPGDRHRAAHVDHQDGQ